MIATFGVSVGSGPRKREFRPTAPLPAPGTGQRRTVLPPSGGVLAAWAEVPGMAAAGSPEAAEAILRDLARAVSSHRRAGGALDGLPPRQQELLRAMDEAQRRFFLEELARADAGEGRDRFRAALGRWRDRERPGVAGPDGVP